MPRNFGLSSRRDSTLPRPTGASANAGVLLFTWEACFQGLHNRLGKTQRPSGQPVAVRVEYMGRVLFAHGGKDYAPIQAKSSPNKGDL